MDGEARLTSKRQMTIPKEIRDRVGMRPGDRIRFTLLPDGRVIMRTKRRRLLDLAGSLYLKGRKPVSIDDLSR
jgi:AbrB family looped-hinge helix DNA binding protein